MSARKLAIVLALLLVSCAVVARAEAVLFLEEPFGSFGGFNPTGHAAVYLSRVCAETPVRLRRYKPGEQGVVIGRYYRISGYDWIAIPLLPYLYAVQDADQIPRSTTEQLVASLRGSYWREHLSGIVPDNGDGSTPRGEWTEFVGSAYDRTIYSFRIDITEDWDDDLIQAFNVRFSGTARTSRSGFSISTTRAQSAAACGMTSAS